jgi:alpha-1,2-mannosyltransferase
VQGLLRIGWPRWRVRLPDALPWMLIALLVGTVLVLGSPRVSGIAGWRDASVYAGAASNFLAHPSHLYDGAQQQINAPAPMAVYLYPPSGLIPFLPLVPLTRSLGVGASVTLWSCVDTVALLAGLALMGRQLGVRPRTLHWALLAVALTGPVLNEVGSGQVQGVVILLLALSWRSWPRASSGLLLGAAMAIKPVIPLLLLLPLALRRPRVSAVAIGTFVAVNLALVPFVGIGGMRFYVLHFIPYLQTHAMQDPADLSLGNVLGTWLGGTPLTPGDAGGVSPLHSALLAGIGVWVVRGALLLVLGHVLWRRSLPPPAVFAVTLALVPFLAATAWPHYFVFAVPALLLLLASPAPRVRAVTGGALVALAVITTVFDVLAPQLVPYPPDLSRVHTVAGAGMFIHSQLLIALCIGLVAVLAVSTRRGGTAPVSARAHTR